jgi:hypothetical protein
MPVLLNARAQKIRNEIIRLEAQAERRAEKALRRIANQKTNPRPRQFGKRKRGKLSRGNPAGVPPADTWNQDTCKGNGCHHKRCFHDEDGCFHPIKVVPSIIAGRRTPRPDRVCNCKCFKEWLGGKATPTLKSIRASYA